MRYLFHIISFVLLFGAFVPVEKPMLGIRPDPQQRVKAVFLYNFSKYFEWPKANKNNMFIIGVLDNPRLCAELTTITQNRKVGVLNIVIKNFKTIQEINKCNIVFIPEESNINVSNVLAIVKPFNGLVVTERQNGVSQGAVVNFVIKENKLKFELSKSNAKKASLKVSQSLTSLAINVD